MTEVRRVAILGGGMASLATALELTAAPDWRSRLDITVYQTGWRLGGKAASSRNPAFGDRIEEHGLHVWFGCYNEAFRLLRGCYEELQRPPGSAFATLDDAFTPQNESILQNIEVGNLTWAPFMSMTLRDAKIKNTSRKNIVSIMGMISIFVFFISRRLM